MLNLKTVKIGEGYEFLGASQFNAWYDYSMHYCWHYMLPFHQYHYWLDSWILKFSNTSKTHKLLGYFLRCFDIVNIKRKIFPIPQEPYKHIS